MAAATVEGASLWEHLAEQEAQLLGRQGPLGEDFGRSFVVVALFEHVVTALELKLCVVFHLQLIELIFNKHRRKVGRCVVHARFN